MTIYSLIELLSQFWTSQLFYLGFYVASWLAYRFLKRQVRWSGIPISLRIFQFVVFHTFKGFWVDRWLVQIQCMKQGTQSWCPGTIQRDGVGREVEGRLRMVGHMYIHGRLMFMYGKKKKKPQYCKVIASN